MPRNTLPGPEKEPETPCPAIAVAKALFYLKTVITFRLPYEVKYYKNIKKANCISHMAMANGASKYTRNKSLVLRIGT